MKCNTNTSTLTKLSSGFTLEKRFESEFEKIEKIGRGGFASVYKVRNFLDNSYYAIKKIKLKIDEKNKDLQKDISGVLQEIRYMAKFKSEHIVTYNHSWVEVNVREESVDKGKSGDTREKKKSSSDASDDEGEEGALESQGDYDEYRTKLLADVKKSLGIGKLVYAGSTEYESNCNYETVKSSVSIDFREESKGKEITTRTENCNSGFQWDEESEELGESSLVNDNIIKIGNKEISLDEIESICIYIQMELCQETLGDYLEKRNKKYLPFSSKRLTLVSVKNSNPQPSLTNSCPCANLMSNKEELLSTLQIFDKILAGIEYIHLKEKLIHRDIKPNNIFFSFDGQIKIGDLGLATDSLNKKCEMMCPSPILEQSVNGEEDYYDFDNLNDELGLESSFKLEIEETQSSPSFNMIEYASAHKRVSFNIELKEEEKLGPMGGMGSSQNLHTSNIGTSQYAAPEQLNNNYYDNKVDIYSLGLVLLELVYPFKTRMEKYDIQEGLKRDRKVPKEINENLSKLGDLLLLMTEIDSAKRVNISQCRTMFATILDTLDDKKDTSSLNFNCGSNINSPKSIRLNPISLYSSKTNSSPSRFRYPPHYNHHSEQNNKEINLEGSNCDCYSDKRTHFNKDRKRFLSEDIIKIEPYKFLIRKEENWENIWVKLFKNKLLIFLKENTAKANIIYDLKECDVKGFQILENSKIDTNKRNSTNFKSKNLALEKVKNIFPKKRKSSDNMSNPYNSNSCKSDEDTSETALANEYQRHLKYIIEVDHPYQQKCVLKSDNVFEGLEFYKHLMKLIE